MRKTIPDHSPLLAPDLICHGCGEVIKPEVVKNLRGIVEHLVYKHRNEEKGCSYFVESTTMITAEMKVLRADEKAVKE